MGESRHHLGTAQQHFLRKDLPPRPTRILRDENKWWMVAKSPPRFEDRIRSLTTYVVSGYTGKHVSNRKFTKNTN